MPKKDTSALWIAGGIAALGLIAAASTSRGPTRQSFDDALRSELLERGLRLVSANFGRRQGVPVWVVTCEMPDGRLLRTEVASPTEPYEDPRQVAQNVCDALAAA